VSGGLKEMQILKTTQSGFTGKLGGLKKDFDWITTALTFIFYRSQAFAETSTPFCRNLQIVPSVQK